MACAKTSALNSGKGMLVVIDPAVKDHDFLAARVLGGAQVIVLKAEQDAIAQITSALCVPASEHTSPFNSIHIIVPGSPGVLHFSNGTLSLKTLKQYVNQLQTWFATGDRATDTQPLEPQVLLYGRQVGAGQSGTELIDTLSWLTGAVVIAAKNGERWPSAADQSVELAFPPSVQQSYQGTFSKQ